MNFQQGFAVSELLWAILAGLVAAGWPLFLFFRDRRLACVELSSALTKRIHEMDKLIIEHPDVQRYLSLSAAQDEGHFRTPDVLQDDTFYKAKSLAYWHLNLFDEIISSEAESKSGPEIFSMHVAELADWESYIRHKLRHPLYRSILNNESHIFGSALREFWIRNKEAVTPSAVDPYSW